jgi:hypothetical protein
MNKTFTLEKIKNLLHFKKQNVSYEKDDTRLFRDWRNMLIGEAILLCVAGGVAFYFYMQINQGKLFTVPPSASEAQLIINNSLLNRIVEEIYTNASSTEALKDAKVPADPSR